MGKLNIKLNLIFGYAVVLLLMLAVSVIAYKSIQTIIKTSNWVTHTHEVIEVGNQVGASMVDMETGKRGFLITGIEEYLEPYYNGLKDFDKYILEGSTLTNDNPAQIIRWQEIKKIKELWILESAQTEIKLRKEVNKGDVAISNFKEISARTLGKALFDDIRLKLNNLKEIYHNNNNNVIKDLITDTTLSLVNMETGQRGYLLSGKEISLEPYIKGEKELSQNFTRLLELTIKTPQMKNDILLIKEAVESWKTKVANVEIDARRVMNQYKYSIDDISKTMRNGKGKFYIDAIRNKVDEIIAVEKSLMDTRFEEQESSASFAANFTIFGTALALIIGAIIAIIISKNIFQAIKENQKKDQLLLQQSKLAAMGEMVGAIAHQWRQPLNALALRNQFIIDDFEDDMIDKEYIEEFSTSSMKLINFMSKTIDDFRNFFRLDKLEKEFSIHEKISETSNMLLSQLTDHQIEINIDKNDFRVMGHDSEFQQVILNLINNAKDALLDNNISSPQINVEVSQEKDMGIIKISDNAGGIPEDVIPRVFEPYFTTKEEGKGTGLGLYMSKMIIEDNMGGHIQVENSKDGAVFTIKLSNLIASNTK